MPLDYFNLKEKRILLYGAATIGIIAYDVFKKAGFDIAGFIDKRGDEIGMLCQKKVYSLDDIISEHMNTDDYAVFISVKNVFEHTNIANDLIEIGLENIIYRPLCSINGAGDELSDQLYEIYDDIISGVFDRSDHIPKSLHKECFKPVDDSIICEEEKYVIAYVSVDMIYSDKKIENSAWYSRPLLSMLPHIELFRFIMGMKDYSVDRYLDYCISAVRFKEGFEVTDRWKQNVINNRSMVFEHMSHSYELDPSFFVRNAPEVIYDSKERVFNLNSGKHRAAFFASLWRKYVPVRIDKEDYKIYLNIDASERLSQMIKQYDITRVDAPIPHPLFFSFPCESNEFYYGLLYALFYHISDLLFDMIGFPDFSSLKIFCRLRDMGFIERALLKAGADVRLHMDESDIPLMSVLDELFGTDLCNRSVNNDDISLDGYDHIILDNTNHDIDNLTDHCYSLKKSCVYVIQNGTSLKNVSGQKEFFSSILNGETVKVFIMEKTGGKVKY